MITYNESGLVGLGFNLGNYQVLVYWYKPKNRPYIAIKHQLTGDYWRV